MNTKLTYEELRTLVNQGTSKILSTKERNAHDIGGPQRKRKPVTTHMELIHEGENQLIVFAAVSVDSF